jgi:hypothetical protein
MDNYEKNVDKAINTVEKVAGVANRFQIGCWIVFANLFLGGFCLWGVYAGYVSWKLEQNGEATTGIVTQLEEGSDSDGNCCVYSPVIEFEANGQTYSFESDNASYPPAYEVGEEVSVLYDPADPNTAQINKWTERWLVPVILVPAMLLTALVVNIVLIRSFWRNDEVG